MTSGAALGGDAAATEGGVACQGIELMLKKATQHGEVLGTCKATPVTRQRQVKLATVQIFGRGIEGGRLYAAYASFDERGARKYWLLKTKSKAHPATKAPSPPSARWRAARPSGRAPW